MTEKPKKLTPAAIAKLGYEDAIEQIEVLLDQVESGEIGLEDALGRVEQGSALLKHCKGILDRVSERMNELTVQDDEAGGDAE